MTKIFDNTQIAFSLKNNNELNRAYFLFKMIANPTLVKVGTALTNIALKLNLPVKGIIRATVFDHFCGGENENDCLKVVDKMFKKNVASVLDYSVEGKEEEAQFDSALQMILKTIEFAEQKEAIPFAVFKPTGFGRLDLYEKVGLKSALSDDEIAEWNRVQARFDNVCKIAFEKNVCLLVDGEESWMQNAADDLVEQMMRKYNKQKALIFNTLQMYRWDRLDYLKKLHARSIEFGFHIGMKVVRGAYMEKEQKRAAELSYPNPICSDKQATDKNYNEALQYMVQNISTMAIYAGTHNEESAYLLMDLMNKYGISKDDNRIWFGQLYGMSDNMSYNLASNDFKVSKYLPFGPVRDVMPYLIRRANENTSVAGQTNRELNLIETERSRRKKV